MVKVGDVALKLAGRDSCQLGVVVEVMDEHYVLIDGNVRRRKCNLKHLEFLDKHISISNGANRKDVIEGLKKSGLKFEEIKKGDKREKKIQTKTNLIKSQDRIEKKKAKQLAKEGSKKPKKNSAKKSKEENK